MSGRAADSSHDTAIPDASNCTDVPGGTRAHFVLHGIAYPLQRDLAPGLTDTQYERVHGILVQNVASRRALRVMEQYFSCTPEGWEQYQRRVLYTFQCEHVRYDALHEGDMAAWETLTRQLTLAAQRMLQRSGMCSQYARDQATELSQQACEHIFAATYPWDISFDLWARTIVRNVFLQRCTRSRDLMDRGPFAPEELELEDLCEHAGPRGAAANHNQAELGTYESYSDAGELIAAIEQMQSQQRRDVILYTFFEELSDEEIAEAIGKSRSAVQTLRHRALRQLRMLLCME